MNHKDKTEVLVVGAGPVGLLNALLLADAGVPVRVIDQESQTTTHSYACALHPRSVRLLNELGIAGDLIGIGRQVKTIAFYGGALRCGEVDLTVLEGEAPFVLCLPQNELESALEAELGKRGVSVEWNHRLTDLRQDKSQVIAHIDKLSETSKGYIIPSWEVVTERSIEMTATYVVGADGQGSIVRDSLSLRANPFGPPISFQVYEFSCTAGATSEVGVSLEEATANVFWPLPHERCRWTFQLPSDELFGEEHTKDRTNVQVVQPSIDRKHHEHAEELVHRRAPWFKQCLGSMEWSTEVQFQARCAEPFGAERCWLAGDAAHETGPIGMQSLNRGLVEATELARQLVRVWERKATGESLLNYGQAARAEWQKLLGLSHQLKTGAKCEPWIRKNAYRLLSCLPASEDDLGQLLDQLDLKLVPK